MDLISRKAAIEEFEDMVTSVSVYGESAEARYATNARIRFIEKLNSIPSVPAVPLDKLCELCEETSARVPCVLCDMIMPEWCKQNNNLPLSWDEEWKCPSWKQLLTKWMEEQNAQTEQPGK